jgi:hypothetical protein
VESQQQLQTFQEQPSPFLEMQHTVILIATLLQQ